MPVRSWTHSRLAPVSAATAAGVATTLVVVATPVRFAYESLELHVALESAQGVIALLLAYLTFGRLKLTGQLRDLVLVLAFCMFAATNLFVSALPVALAGDTVQFAEWTAVALRLLAAATMAVAALTPDRDIGGQRARTRAVGAVVVVLAVGVALGALADANFGELIDPDLAPDTSTRPLFAGHAAAVAVQVLSTVLMTLAAFAFSVRATRSEDELLRWLAAGASIGALARLNYLLFPSLYTAWFYAGDVLRFGSYLFFLVGAAREIGSYWRRQAEAAVGDERRRVARELHDGLTQELAFIRSQVTTSTGAGIRPEMLQFIAEAADRALGESRKIVSALADPSDSRSQDGPLVEALRRAAEEVAHRSGVVVLVDGDEVSGVPASVRVALERVVREATGNAVRHGDPSSVTVEVTSRDSQLVVRVRDDGRGFDPSTRRPGGFGLTTMRERAEALGGTMRIDSAPERGTTIEVVIPS